MVPARQVLHRSTPPHTLLRLQGRTMGAQADEYRILKKIGKNTKRLSNYEKNIFQRPQWSEPHTDGSDWSQNHDAEKHAYV